MKVSAIAIISRNKGLGFENHLLFHIPGELPRLKKITMGEGPVGHALIMGRKTFDSIGKPLPGRLNIVVTRQGGEDIPGVCIFVDSLEKALEVAKDAEVQKPENQQEVFILGGGQIFKEALPLTDRLYLTIVNHEVVADVFFPAYEKEFTKIIEKEEKTDWEYPYTFLTLER